MTDRTSADQNAIPHPRPIPRIEDITLYCKLCNGVKGKNTRCTDCLGANKHTKCTTCSGARLVWVKCPRCNGTGQEK